MRRPPLGPTEPGGAQASYSDLLAAVPDVPRSVEARAMLLSGRCTVLRAPNDRANFVVSSVESLLLSVVGAPAAEQVRAAVERNGYAGTVIAPVEARDLVAGALGDWRAEEAVIHALPGKPLGPRPGRDVRLLPAGEVQGLEGTPPDLARDLALLDSGAPVAVAFDGDRPAAFCYAGWETESLWDVSIDTIEPYRRRGHAHAAAALLIDQMAARGMRPVWGALVSNLPSRRVASNLGFAAVDRLLVFLPRSAPVEVHW